MVGTFRMETCPMLVCARLRHAGLVPSGATKKYMNMKHLEAASEDVPVLKLT